METFKLTAEGEIEVTNTDVFKRSKENIEHEKKDLLIEIAKLDEMLKLFS